MVDLLARERDEAKAERDEALAEVETWRAHCSRLEKERDTHRDEAVRQMHYGIKQHEFAQDALRERDKAVQELAHTKAALKMLAELFRDISLGSAR